MLNISHNQLNKKGDYFWLRLLIKKLLKGYTSSFSTSLLELFFICLVIMMFLPWTQNVTADGYVTTLTPDQRPQTIQSQIPGRIEKWHVKRR